MAVLSGVFKPPLEIKRLAGYPPVGGCTHVLKTSLLTYLLHRVAVAGGRARETKVSGNY